MRYPTYRDMQSDLSWWREHEPHIAGDIKLNAPYEVLRQHWYRVREEQSRCAPYFTNKYGTRYETEDSRRFAMRTL